MASERLLALAGEIVGFQAELQSEAKTHTTQVKEFDMMIQTAQQKLAEAYWWTVAASGVKK
jgi:hypothetical protein